MKNFAKLIMLAVIVVMTASSCKKEDCQPSCSMANGQYTCYSIERFDDSGNLLSKDTSVFYVYFVNHQPIKWVLLINNNIPVGLSNSAVNALVFSPDTSKFDFKFNCNADSAFGEVYRPIGNQSGIYKQTLLLRSSNVQWVDTVSIQN